MLHPCLACPKTFINHQDYHNHSKTHQTPFKCPECSKTFSYRATLKKHLLIHTNEKNFVCKVCYKAMNRKENMKRHYETVHKLKEREFELENTADLQKFFREQLKRAMGNLAPVAPTVKPSPTTVARQTAKSNGFENKGYHTFVPFFAPSKCSLMIDPILFKWCHTFAMSLLTISMLLPIGFSIERFIALLMAEKYENIALDLTIVKFVYQNEKFSDTFLSFVLTPTASASQVNIYFSSLLAVKLFNLVCNCILIKIHMRIKKRYYRRTHSLSLRYELEEIVQSSKFTLIISFFHLVFFGWYLTVTITVRFLGESFLGGFLNYTVFRGMYCTVPTYSLVIVLVGFKSLRHLNIQRHNKVQSTVQIKSTGREGATNYDNAISNYWDSVSHGLDRMNR
ncbi:Protein CBR-SRB-3 [Caenorhabditis briggsae]|uniref:Protein CBR-SRB-3 n=1 Tax=Caenorhabditis briggsae TaxID=6238 RepID=A8WUJ7_CAEBR|nr:Protein CBR-SRB-3 [Caenorhabditis briggsae]CAP24159.2 Protein CBR-SRB-3 [Caenorhabditis briggsae]